MGVTYSSHFRDWRNKNVKAYPGFFFLYLNIPEEIWIFKTISKISHLFSFFFFYKYFDESLATIILARMLIVFSYIFRHFGIQIKTKKKHDKKKNTNQQTNKPIVNSGCQFSCLLLYYDLSPPCRSLYISVRLCSSLLWFFCSENTLETKFWKTILKKKKKFLKMMNDDWLHTHLTQTCYALYDWFGISFV